MTKIAGLLLLLIITYPLFGQSDIAFIASTNADEVIPGQPFEVQYEIRNATVNSFNTPDFQPLNKISGPNVSSSLRIVNGRRTSSKTYSFTLSAPRAGSYTLSPASCKADGKILKSNSLLIEVIPPPAQKDKKGKGKVLLQLVASDTSPYVGEQLILDYVLLYNEPVENIYRMNELDFTGFYTSGINNFPRTVHKTSIDGKPYSRQIIKRVALFGQQSGEYTFGPLFLRVEVLNGGQNSPFSIFRNTESHEIYADPLNINVESLPEGAPPNFSGGVGKFSMQARAEEQQVSVGEAVEITVRVEGKSDPNILDPPALILDGKAEAYTPQLDYDSENVAKGVRSFTKTWTYLVVPEEEGKFSVQPYLIHLNTETGTYDSLMAQKMDLWAKPASAKENDVIPDSIDPKVEGSKNNWWPWILTGLIILLFVAALYYRYRKRNNTLHSTKEEITQITQFIIQQKKKPLPDIGKIKEQLQRLKTINYSHAISEETIITWVKKLDFHQYSPVKNSEKLRELLDEIAAELRKA